jgi:hypothetical protein
MRSGELSRQPTRTLDESLLTDPEGSDRPCVEFLASTPGRLAVLAIVLIAAVLAAGVTASTTIAGRRDRLETLRSHTEPLADAAQRIYGALSIANTAATTGFLSGGIEPQDVGDRYDAAIGQASSGLVTASSGVAPNDVRSLRLLNDLSNRLAVYTGMIATARANNRAGRPIGVAYLSAASALMQQAILPSAEQLHRSQADVVGSSERSAGPLRAVIAISVFALGVLVFAQAFLTKHSHRRLNPGLVLASVLMAVLAVWLSVASLLSGRATSDALTDGSEPLATVVTARILAQQARADEILGLLKRGSDTQSDKSFDARIADLSQLLDRYPVGGAVGALEGWVRSHDEIRRSLAAGDYPGAVAIAHDDEPQHSTDQFIRLDAALRDEITQRRDRQRDAIARAYTALNLLTPGAAAIGVLAALAVTAGIWPRLNEYH